MNDEKLAVILLGPPGSGKSTLIDNLAADERIGFIKTGNLLRREVDQKTPLGHELKDTLEAGHLAPSRLVYEVIEGVMSRMTVDYFLFDGFPRCEDQVELFFELSRKIGFRLALVIVLHLNRDIAVERLTGRRICPSCGAVYNKTSNPPAQTGLCDRCGATLEQRRDDMEDAVAERLQEYVNQTVPVIHFFKTQHTEITHEEWTGRPLEELMDALAPRLDAIGLRFSAVRSTAGSAEK